MIELVNKAKNKYFTWWNKKELSEQVVLIALVPIVYGVWLIIKTWRINNLILKTHLFYGASYLRS
ncbi:TPA: hypothetical protein J1388_002521 [Escherichia coli]|nr:hypothetical protein [Escherichia coli]